MPPKTTPPTPIKLPKFTTPEDLAKFIRKMAKSVEAVFKNGNKSVTAIDKSEILNITNAISEASNQITPVMETTTVCKSIDAEELMACVRKELSDFKIDLTNANAQYSTESSKKTYATVASNGDKPRIKTPISRPAIVISSKDANQTQNEVINEWRKSVSFKKNTFTPARILPISKNKVRIEFDTEEQRNATLKKAQECNKINAEVAKRRKPMIIIKGVSNEVKSEELIELIRQQNPSVDATVLNDSDIRLCFLRKNYLPRNINLYNAVIETTPSVRQSILELKRLNIDDRRIHVEDFSPFVQCYKCLQFGHTKNKCNATEEPCSHCASIEHSFKDCPVKKDATKSRCFNCKSHNAKNNASDNDAHSATSSKNCPRIKALIKRITQRVDYGC